MKCPELVCQREAEIMSWLRACLGIAVSGTLTRPGDAPPMTKNRSGNKMANFVYHNSSSKAPCMADSAEGIPILLLGKWMSGQGRGRKLHSA